jgi:hypothetical protein
MLKYNTLLKILDNICDEAPSNYFSYHPDRSDNEKIILARSKAFVHLFLKVKCGITNFRDRHDLITDGSQDGGVDGFFIDREKKKLYLIQSKFRPNQENFEEKSITADDLVKMEINRILKGEDMDSNGNEFNSKIKSFQERWRKTPNPALYKNIVIILGNLTRYNDSQIRRLIDNEEYEIFDFKRTYDELTFPLCSGTYYDPKEIEITINLNNKEQSTLKQKITTKFGEFQVRVLFVPASEIGRILSQYKNAILKYNPRNYLSLSKNKVNQSIRDSILNYDTNDFAVLNNGITIICDSFKISESTGNVDVGQIILTHPQIINGGQTAYTLSRIYESHKNTLNEVFGDKEVVLKIIIVSAGEEFNVKFIEEISNATNQQNRVEEADRRSNEPIQIEIQKLFYENFGYLYERKRGEFHYGLEGNYINKEQIINRYELLRAYLALKGEPRWARQRGSETLFKPRYFRDIINDSNDYKKMLFSYFVLRKLYDIEKEITDSSWGYGLRYGKMAIIAGIGYFDSQNEITKDTIANIVVESIDKIKPKWIEFEQFAKSKPENSSFISEDFEYDFYYKGKTVDNDVKEFFSKNSEEQA